MNIGSNEELLRSIRAHGYDAETPLVGVLCERLEGILDELEDALEQIGYVKEHLQAVETYLYEPDKLDIECAKEALANASEAVKETQFSLTNR